MGFLINYLRFLDLIGDDELMWVRALWLLNAGTISISVFLHTLRFKRKIPPKLAFTLYLLMFYSSFLGGLRLLPLFSANLDLVGVCALGTLLNLWRGHQWLLKVYFVLVMAVLVDKRDFHMLPPASSWLQAAVAYEL